jgi:hypothetical protein
MSLEPRAGRYGKDIMKMEDHHDGESVISYHHQLSAHQKESRVFLGFSRMRLTCCDVLLTVVSRQRWKMKVAHTMAKSSYVVLSLDREVL